MHVPGKPDRAQMLFGPPPNCPGNGIDGNCNGLMRPHKREDRFLQGIELPRP